MILGLFLIRLGQFFAGAFAVRALINFIYVKTVIGTSVAPIASGTLTTGDLRLNIQSTNHVLKVT